MIMDTALDMASRATAETAATDALRFAQMRQRLGQVRGGRKPRGSPL
jgi:hypothetical protein